MAATACAVSLVSWHTVSYCSFQLGTPSSSAERTQMERQWWWVEESKTAPLSITEQGTVGGTQTGHRDAPVPVLVLVEGPYKPAHNRP